MMRRNLTVLSAILVLGAATAAEAQEIMLEGPLAGAPACRECVQYRHGRFSITPSMFFTLLDDYRRHIFVGARLTYNITDWIGISIAGGYGGFWGDLLDTGLTDEVSEKAPNGIDSNRANYPFAADSQGAQDAERLTTELLGRILGFVSAEVVFTPLRGKFGLFSRLFLDVDLYIFAGYALPFVEERAGVDCRTRDFIENRGYVGGRTPDGWPADVNQVNAETCPWVGSSSVATEEHVPRDEARLAVGAGTYGIGASIYFNDWIAMVFEYRVMPFQWNHTGTDERGMALAGDPAVLTFCPSDAGSGDDDYCGDTGEFPDHRIDENDRTWTANHLFTVGVTFHFPLTPRRTE